MLKLTTLSAVLLGALAGCATPAAVRAQAIAMPDARGRVIFGSCAQKPIYPAEAARENRSGNMVLSFLIDANDALLDAKVKHGTGHADLDEAARVGLSTCKFKAAVRKGEPVRDWVDVSYRWTR